jgi:hypothetical protein
MRPRPCAGAGVRVIIDDELELVGLALGLDATGRIDLFDGDLHAALGRQTSGRSAAGQRADARRF